MSNPYEKLKMRAALTVAAFASMFTPGAGVSASSKKDDAVPVDATVQRLQDITHIKAEDTLLLEAATYEASMSVNPFSVPLPPQDPKSAIPKQRPEWAYLDNLEIGQTKEQALRGEKPAVIIEEPEVKPRPSIQSYGWPFMRISREEGIEGGIRYLDEEKAPETEQTLEQSVRDTQLSI